MNLNAEWIPYMHAYRLYKPEKPQNTVAYVDDIDEKELAELEEQGYDKVSICDADTMHIELY